MPHEEVDLPQVVTISFHDVDPLTPWVFVGRLYTMAAQVQVRSSFTWSTGVIGMEWTLDDQDYEEAITFSPVVSFTSSVKGLYDIDVANKVWVRFRTTTAEAANDPSAKIVYMVQR